MTGRRRRAALRVMTYNVHRCVGIDGRLSPERIARIIARHDPDFVALQELDVRRRRTNGVDQAHAIARHLEMSYHFHPTIALEEERYGNAILSRLPMRLAKRGILPGAGLAREPRGAIWVTLDLDGLPLQVVNTHLGLGRGERLAQANALLGPDWLGHADCNGHKILLGDLNAGPTSPVVQRLTTEFKDAQLDLAAHRPRNTWFGPMPARRIDHVLVDAEIDVVSAQVPAGGMAWLASDHLPLVVDLEVSC